MVNRTVINICLTLVCLLYSSIVFGQSENSRAATTGPDTGSLLIVGGGKLGVEIVEKFLDLAGGKDAKIILIPTAGGGESYDDNFRGAQTFRDAGATSVKVLHANSKAEASSASFLSALENADAIWFSGGRQWRLVDSYKDTKAEKMFWEVLARGGVIGGSSAGATIQGSYLARGDTKNNQVMMGDHEVGFAFVKNIAIDQHVIARNRHFDMFNILDQRPELLGLSIDESTAIVVKKNSFEVLGKSYVIVFDGGFWSREGNELKMLPKDNLFYFLREGDKYDLLNRKVILEN